METTFVVHGINPKNVNGAKLVPFFWGGGLVVKEIMYVHLRKK